MNARVPTIAVIPLLCLMSGSAAVHWEPRVHFSQYAGASPDKDAEILKAQNILKKWPALLREAILTEHAELFFTLDGSCPYAYNGRKIKDSINPLPYKQLLGKAKFIATNGKMYSWIGEAQIIRHRIPGGYQEWVEIKNAMAKYGEETVLAPFSKELAILKRNFANRENLATTAKNTEIRTAQEHLRNWPRILRETLLTEYAELLYMDDGSLPYKNGGQPRQDSKELAPYKEIRPEAKFIGADANIYLWNNERDNNLPLTNRGTAEWADAKNAMAKYGAKAILAPFSKELAILKKNFANRNKGIANPKKEQQPRSAENVEKKATAIVNMLQDNVAGEARMAVAVCLEEHLCAQEALYHSYINPKGELCFVYEQLQKDECTDEALRILEKASEADEIVEKALSKLGRVRKASQKGKELRAMRMQVLQKQLEAAVAQLEAQLLDSDNTNEGIITLATVEMIEKTQDQASRAALIRIASEKLTCEDLFNEMVFDSGKNPHSCYDSLRNANMLEQAVGLMRDLEVYEGLADTLSNRYATVCETQSKQREKRSRRIELAYKQYEAIESQRKLEKLERK